MKITTIVMAAALAVSSGCAFAAGAGTPGAAAGGALGRQAAPLVRGPVWPLPAWHAGTGVIRGTFPTSLPQ
jgi:hypothetical protein